jgi:hypothetical protein
VRQRQCTLATLSAAFGVGLTYTSREWLKTAFSESVLTSVRGVPSSAVQTSLCSPRDDAALSVKVSGPFHSVKPIRGGVEPGDLLPAIVNRGGVPAPELEQFGVRKHGAQGIRDTGANQSPATGKNN